MRQLDRYWGRPSRLRENFAKSRREKDPSPETKRDDSDLPRCPKTRGGCSGIPRPCPHVGCAYNCYLEVRLRSDRPTVTLSHPGMKPWEINPRNSCSLDVASEGRQTLERVGRVLGLTRERVRQIETKALEKLGEMIRTKQCDLDLAEDMRQVRKRLLLRLRRQLQHQQKRRK